MIRNSKGSLGSRTSIKRANLLFKRIRFRLKNKKAGPCEESLFLYGFFIGCEFGLLPR